MSHSHVSSEIFEAAKQMVSAIKMAASGLPFLDAGQSHHFTSMIQDFESKTKDSTYAKANEVTPTLQSAYQILAGLIQADKRGVNETSALNSDEKLFVTSKLKLESSIKDYLSQEEFKLSVKAKKLGGLSHPSTPLGKLLKKAAVDEVDYKIRQMTREPSQKRTAEARMKREVFQDVVTKVREKKKENLVITVTPPSAPKVEKEMKESEAEHSSSRRPR